MCDCGCDDPPVFWSLVVKPGDGVPLEFPPETYLTITQATISEIPDDNSPVRIFADVSSVGMERDEAVTIEQNVLIASICPATGVLTQPLNLVFSVANLVTLKVVGKVDVSLTGHLIMMEDYGIFMEEEEEEEGIFELEEEEEEEGEENNDHIAAHQFATNHMKQLKNDKKCGCFRCLKIYSPTEIEDWLDKGTAMCPHCGIDAVIGESSGYPITRKFLKKMNKQWFNYRLMTATST